MTAWLLLHYKIPPEPSARRVQVWRRLKRLGAVRYQDAVWVLPSTPRTLEQFQWLAEEILERGGQAALWEAGAALPDRSEALVRLFQDQADRAYREILRDLDRGDLVTLARQYQQARIRDYFHSEIGEQVRSALLARRAGPA